MLLLSSEAYMLCDGRGCSKGKRGQVTCRGQGCFRDPDRIVCVFTYEPMTI